MLYISHRCSLTRVRTYTVMFLLYLWTDAVDIGSMVLSGGGEPCRAISGGRAPAGRAMFADAGVGGLETFNGFEVREFVRWEV